jgi:methylglutamate dehydrogenase subunit D
VADPSEPRSALADLAVHGGAAALTGEPGVTVGELRGGVILQLGRPGRKAVVAAALANFGLSVLPRMGHAARGPGVQLVSVGPGQWLFVTDGPSPDAAPPHGRLAPAFAPVLIMSDAWTRIRIAGARSRDLLAKGAVLDLHPKAFAAGACAATAFAGMRTILWRGDGDDSFDLLVRRSLAVALWHWLVETSEEFGGACLLAAAG